MCVADHQQTEKFQRNLERSTERQIKNQITRAKSGKYDDYTRIHLDESLMRINRALNAQQTIGSGGGGAPISLLQLLGGADGGEEAPVGPSLKQP